MPTIEINLKGVPVDELEDTKNSLLAISKDTDINIIQSHGIGVFEAISIAIIGQIAGTLISDLIERVLKLKEDKKEINVTIHFSERNQTFKLPDQIEECNKFISNDEDRTDS